MTTVVWETTVPETGRLAVHVHADVLINGNYSGCHCECDSSIVA